jgi:hypothetical protein
MNTTWYPIHIPHSVYLPSPALARIGITTTGILIATRPSLESHWNFNPISPIDSIQWNESTYTIEDILEVSIGPTWRNGSPLVIWDWIRTSIDQPPSITVQIAQTNCPGQYLLRSRINITEPWVYSHPHLIQSTFTHRVRIGKARVAFARLRLLTFGPPPPTTTRGRVNVRHIDDDITNDSLDNLTWTISTTT